MDELSAGVYAIRYASRPLAKRQEHFYRKDERPEEVLPLDYFVWAIVGDDGDVILVDTGYSRATAEIRGNRTYVASPAETLRELGVPAARVRSIVITHLHYDHAGTIDDFLDAVVYVQKSEFDFWTSPLASRGEYPHEIEAEDLAAVCRRKVSGTLELRDGDYALNTNVTVHLVGGHSPGLQIVRVVAGPHALVLASDSSHFYENIDNDRPFAIVDHLPSMYRAFDTAKSLASDPRLVVPGHDPQVLVRFPAVDGFAGRVVRLI
jgi:glyoxylase-like metal-dependent hydrolase (beta-lactamase superfamily II)